MEVSPQDPPLMAMDLSKTYNRRTRSHPESVDLAKKPEWYHRRPPSCSAEHTTSSSSSSYRTRASSSYNSLSSPQTGAAVHCRDMEQGPEPLGNYMNSTLAPRLDLYRDGVRGNLWHQGFYGADQGGGPVPESSGGEESDSGSDVIFLVSSAKEPLLCGSFIQDGVRHIVEPLSPAVSSLDEGRGCYHLPQPLSSPSPDSSYSEDSSDSSVDIPVHHARPVVLLSDLGAVYGNPAESAVDISSDDSDVIEVSVTDEKKKQSGCCKKTSPRRESKNTPAREVRRSNRIRKSMSESPQLSCSVSRHSLRRQVKNDAVGIYNESCDSDDMMEFAMRVSSSDESGSQPNQSPRASSNSESEVNTRTDSNSSQQHQQPRRKAPYVKSTNHQRKKPLAVPKAKKLKRTNQKENCRVPQQQEQQEEQQQEQKQNVSPAKKNAITRRKRKRRLQTGPSTPFPHREPEIIFKYAKAKEEKKDKKSVGFCPFIRMERRMCTVVNYQEEVATVQSGRGGQQQLPAAAASRSLSGFVPNTSCFQLGRMGSDGRCLASLLCCLCGQTANAMGLGDLHGPYCPIGPPVDFQSGSRAEQKEDSHGPSNSRSVNSSDDDGASKSPPESSERSPPKVLLRLDECWIHEDCGIWSTGIFLIRGKLYGLEEATRLAAETICSTCQLTGAIMGCFQKGCPRNYHYKCALQSGCVLNEENFSMRCPEHKNKLFTSATRKHKR